MAAVFGVMIAACTSSNADEAITSTAPTSGPSTIEPGAEPTAASINDALGGTQAVQDFAIFVAMWDESGDEPETFYREVLDFANQDSAELGALSGNFTLHTVTSVTGEVVDSAGNPVPSLTAEYGLMTPSEASIAEAVKGWGDGSEAAEELAKLVLSSDLSSAPLLVEVITADYTMARTHAGPGDMVLMDISAVESVAPGADVAMSYIFGQTLPGDPDIERDLAPLDLFRYRWNQGLVAVLSDPDTGDVASSADHSVEIVSGATASREELEGQEKVPTVELVSFPGSSSWTAVSPSSSASGVAANETRDDDGAGDGAGLNLSQREIKQLILIDFFSEQHEGFTDYFLSAESGYHEGPNGEIIAIDYDHNEVVVLDRTEPGETECDALGCRDFEVIAWMTYSEFASRLATHFALSACNAKAAQLNLRNSAQTSLNEIGPPSERVAPSAGGSGGPGSDDQSGDDPLAPQPAPVSCAPPDPGEFPPRPPKLPTGDLTGDIHIHTIDGNHYSNQAAGEFLLLENEATTIQVRTEPWGDSETVSVATALAFSLGGHNVSVHAGGETRIDGEVEQLERGIPMPVGGGELLWWHGGWVVVWPDGTILRVHEREVALVANVTPSSGPTNGLFGDNDGDPNNDLYTRNGEVLAPDADEDFESFYDVYVDSWRISNDESLFNYDEGESTETFTVEGFPSEHVTTDDLPADVFAEAELLCREVGVTAEEVVDNCILDVALTGDPLFAYDAYLAQEARSDPSGTGPVEPGTTAEETNTLVIGDITIAFGPEPPIVDSSGVAPSWSCEASDGVFTAFSTFPESPTISYDLEVQYIAPDNSRGLSEAFRVIVRRNSEDYAWVQTAAEQFANAVDPVSLKGVTLVASGELFVNDPPQPGLQPISPLPDGVELTSFILQTECES